jgi:hypothetical protein
METAYLVQILLGMLGGALAWLFLHTLLGIKLFRLQIAVEQVRTQLLSLQGREKAQARWSKEEALAQEFLKAAPHKTERFANDPVWGERG